MKIILLLLFIFQYSFSLQWCEENNIIKCYEDNLVTQCKQTLFEQKENYLQFNENVNQNEIQIECNLTQSIKILIGKKRRKNKI